jgi:hypothetical protein
MANPSVVIDIAAEYTGKKAFDKAGTSTQKLEKSVKSLARTFGLAFSTTAVLAYGKASVKAAAADIKAQKQLALTLKNVGLEREAATAEGYIQRIEKEFAVVDDKLRPAYASLSVATKDTAKTQRLLGIALDISASTGKDLNAVVAALSKAYLGNNTSLGKLGVGISKADLKTQSFKDITDQLAVTFAGAAKSSADEFAGSMDKLAIASNNAKEIIGTSLINALVSVGEDDSMATLSSNIESAASSLANFVDSIVYLKEQVKSIPGAGVFGYLFSGVTDLLGRFSPQTLAKKIEILKGFQGMGNVSMTGGSNQNLQQIKAIEKKSAAAKAKSDKAAAAAKIAADKKAAANKAILAKAESIFNLDQIQIEAALKGKISADEKLRLELQRAILNEDFDLADKLQKKLEASQKATAALQGQINAIKPATDPFEEWIKSLKEIGETLSKILGMPINTSSGMLNPKQPIVASQDPKISYKDPDPDPIPVVIVSDPAAAADLAATATQAAELAVKAAAEAMADALADQAITDAIVAAVTNNGFAAGGSSSMFNPYATTPGSSAGFGTQGTTTYPSVQITIMGNVLDGDDFEGKVTQAMINSQRKGYSQTPAGSLP